MRAATAARCAAALYVACFTLACHSKAKHETAVSRNVDAIMRALNLPARPVEAWWEETPVGQPGGIGPTDYDLSAVLLFDPATAASLAKKAPPLPEAPVLLPSEALRPWLPEPVRAALQRHGDDFLSVRGSKFDAQPFLKPPYTSGAFIVIDGGGYVYISVRTS